jgi:hypothetical protein
MIETTAACIRGCALRGRHLGECDDEECRGCLPRRAQHGHLCWNCHRRLELWLHDAETVDRWLTGNLATGQGAAPEQTHITGSKELPLPIKQAVYDQRQVLRDFYAATADELIERESLTTAGNHGVASDAALLLRWLSRIEYWPHVGDLWEYLGEEMGQAHALAPWRPAVRRVHGIPCPECAEVNLIIFGGESDVTCGSCGLIIPERAFGLWERIVKQENGIEVAG